MKKYMTPALSELLELEDVLANSELDNVTDDPATGDDYDKEDELIVD
ncbi:MAG: hypothetical protein ACI3XA_00515 [Clostridia bacterium]